MVAAEAEIVHQALKKNVGLFSWTTSDIPRVSPYIITLKLLVYKEVRLMAQKKRKLGEEKRLAAREEVEELLSTDFIRETCYITWLAKVFMVTEANGKWRMYVDYTNLDKACPKDSYPLPNIDRLVDGAACHNILSFLDAYSGYSQISMYLRDKEKITFMTDKTNYYYEVMSFGLKNVGTTY